MESIIFQIDGGIGKNVVATAVVRAINKKYPDKKIVIVTAYSDVWTCNPRVHRVIQFGQQNYFYNDFVEDKNTLFFLQEPYKHQDYIYNRKHLTELWCDLCGVEWDGEKPELYFTNLEYDFVADTIKKDKPIFLVQPFGGAQNQQHKYSWARDIPPQVAQDVVNHMRKDYRVIQVRREDQIALDGAEYLSLNPRFLALSILMSDKRLFIDSYMQHAAAALNQPSTVLWIANSPNVLGYTLHNNIQAKFQYGSLKTAMYDPYDILGDPIQLATPPTGLFKSDDIIAALTTERSTMTFTDGMQNMEI